MKVLIFVVPILCFLSSESDESVVDVDKNVDSDDDISIISVSSNTTLKNSVKTRGELDITDLPPIEDLKISVDEEKCQPVGCIKSIVDTLGKYNLLNSIVLENILI